MVTTEQWCNKLRELAGTPFVHQGRTRHGVDCYGLPVLAASELGIDEPSYYGVNGYGVLPGKNELRSNIGRFLKPRPYNRLQPVQDQARLGDFLVFHIDDRNASRHIGIFTKYENRFMFMTHADMRRGRVLETRITATVWMVRLNSIWYLPKLEGAE